MALVVILLSLVAALIIGLLPDNDMASEQDEWVKNKANKHQGLLPDFDRITDVTQKKDAFIEFLLPMIQQANNAIAKERRFLIELELARLSNVQQQKLQALAMKYQEPLNAHQTLSDGYQALLKKVDQIPAGLALAQAANESAWGSSRFAREGLNFYGHWCFSAGCGLVPHQRPEGETYEVRRFNTVADSVAAYMLNLNAFNAYAPMRELRWVMRQNQQPLDSQALAEGLLAYSTKRSVYIEELQAMIRFNQLDQWD